MLFEESQNLMYKESLKSESVIEKYQIRPISSIQIKKYPTKNDFQESDV